MGPDTVARELGHESLDTVLRIFSHVQHLLHRFEVVEYSVEHFADLEEMRRRRRPLQAIG